MKFPLASRTFVWHVIKKWLDRERLQMIEIINLTPYNFLGLFFCRKNVITFRSINITYEIIFSTKVDTALVQTRLGK